jgi:hypothetical protein
MDEAAILQSKRREIGFLLFLWLAPALAAGGIAAFVP